MILPLLYCFFFFQAEDGIRDDLVTGVQTCALPIFKTEHEKLAMDAWRSPPWVLNDHSEDQFLNFLRRLSSPDGPSDLGDQLPVQMRSEERRVGKECRSRWSPYH